MSASYDLFCRWKHVQKIQSDNAGALALGVSRATVSLWKQGKNAEIHYIERMAVDIGDSPEMWSAVVMAERSNSEDEKAAWRRIAQNSPRWSWRYASLWVPPYPRRAGYAAGWSCLARYTLCEILYRTVAAFVSSAWQWLGLWLGSCLRPQCSLTDISAALKQRFWVSRQTFWVDADREQRFCALVAVLQMFPPLITTEDSPQIRGKPVQLVCNASSGRVWLLLAHHFMMLPLATAWSSEDLACPGALAQHAAFTSGIKLRLSLNIFECSHRARTQPGQRQIPCDLRRVQLRSTPQ